MNNIVKALEAARLMAKTAFYCSCTYVLIISTIYFVRNIY